MKFLDKFFCSPNYNKRIKYIYSFFFGTLLVLCLPPYNFWILIFPSISFLFFQSYLSKSSRESFLIGWFFGFAFFLFGVYWIFNSFLIRSDIFIYLIPFCLILLSSLLAIFTGLVSFFNYKLKRNLIANIIFFSVFWTLSEILRGYVFTGFPWNLIAHTWLNFNNILQICSVRGVYGLTFFTVLIVLSVSIILIKEKILKKNIFYFSSVFISIFLIILFGYVRLNNLNSSIDNSVKFRVVQPNIKQKDKLDINYLEENFKKILDLSFSNKLGTLNSSENLIIIWPETAITDLNYLSKSKLFNKIKLNLKKNEYIISGFFRIEQDKSPKFYNSVLVIDKSLSKTFIYDKKHLVPFGEYIPFSGILNKLGFNFIGLQKGKNSNNLINLKNTPKFKTLICYEIIFPGKYSNSKNKAVFLLNLTNDAWFGNTTGPHQHFANTIFRAIEEGRNIIRVANTGISASVDPLGRIIQKIDLNNEGTFDTNIVVVKKNNKIIKTIYSRFGNALIILILISFFCFFLKFKLKN